MVLTSLWGSTCLKKKEKFSNIGRHERFIGESEADTDLTKALPWDLNWFYKFTSWRNFHMESIIIAFDEILWDVLRWNLLKRYEILVKCESRKRLPSSGCFASSQSHWFSKLSVTWKRRSTLAEMKPDIHGSFKT